jgi:hypothetical protein
VPTNTEHPVPQNLHDAFCQSIFVLSSSTIRLVATAGKVMPATAAADAAACALTKARLVRFMDIVPSRIRLLDVVVHESGTQHVIESGNLFDHVSDVSLCLGFKDDDKFAVLRFTMNLSARQVSYCLFDAL